ncbi:MAG: hypothetical protein IKJ48_07925 [Alistipes sp.]|nr:hypothetical protein [Alistipes sp.]
MTTRLKTAICYTAVILSFLFLIIGVDYLPVLLCWIPLIVTLFFVAKCDSFVESVNRLIDKIPV